jgi:hypothetical protein
MTAKLPVVVPVAPVALAHLFRHSLREGRVHPLLHVVQRYRQEALR